MVIGGHGKLSNEVLYLRHLLLPEIEGGIYYANIDLYWNVMALKKQNCIKLRNKYNFGFNFLHDFLFS